MRAAAILSVGASRAQATEVGNSRNFGLGFQIGDPTAITAKAFLGRGMRWTSGSGSAAGATAGAGTLTTTATVATTSITISVCTPTICTKTT